MKCNDKSRVSTNLCNRGTTRNCVITFDFAQHNFKHLQGAIPDQDLTKRYEPDTNFQSARTHFEEVTHFSSK